MCRFRKNCFRALAKQESYKITLLKNAEIKWLTLNKQCEDQVFINEAVE